MRSVRVAASGYVAEVFFDRGKREVVVRRTLFTTALAQWNVERNVDAPRSGHHAPRVSYYATPAFGFSSTSFSTLPGASMRDVALCAIETYVKQIGGAS